jgi:hypothetical protein
MAEARSVKCPNCSAPMLVPLGEVEVDCAFCASRVRFIPGTEELEVVRKREELKSRERVAIQQEAMRQQLQREEAAAWRQTAAKVAISALPIVGRSAGSAIFKAALRRGGCPGCGCLLPIAILGGLFVLIFGLR